MTAPGNAAAPGDEPEAEQHDQQASRFEDQSASNAQRSSGEAGAMSPALEIRLLLETLRLIDRELALLDSDPEAILSPELKIVHAAFVDLCGLLPEQVMP